MCTSPPPAPAAGTASVAYTGRSLYDALGFEWTLLRLGSRAPSAESFTRAAANRKIELKIVDVPGDDARDLYAAHLALIRPDQLVAWRGNDPAEADTIMATVLGL